MKDLFKFMSFMLILGLTMVQQWSIVRLESSYIGFRLPQTELTSGGENNWG